MLVVRTWSVAEIRFQGSSSHFMLILKIDFLRHSIDIKSGIPHECVSEICQLLCDTLKSRICEVLGKDASSRSEHHDQPTANVFVLAAGRFRIRAEPTQ